MSRAAGRARSARPLIVFAPGAGAPSTSAWMRAWAARLATLGEVVRFDYPYVLGGRRAPDRLPLLIAAHRAALQAARARHPAARATVLVGKSMGSRVGRHLSLEAPVDALVCLGYPLRGRGGELRHRVLLELRTPVLFAQGTRDPLCPIVELESVRKRMSALSRLHVVEGGDHGLAVTRRALRAAREAQEDVDRRTLEAIGDFLSARLVGQAGSAG